MTTTHKAPPVPAKRTLDADQALFVVNPMAGAGRRDENERRIRSDVPGARIHRTTHRGEASAVAAAATRAGVPLIVVVGGDGTLGEVVDGIVRARGDWSPAVGFVPAGTCNDFARGRELCRSLSELLVCDRAGPVDVGRVTFQTQDGLATRHFVVNCTIGLVTAIGERFTRKGRIGQALKRRSVTLAEAVYSIDALLHWRPVRLRIESDAGAFAAPVTNLGVLNVPYFAGGLSFGPVVAPDDGLLTLAVVAGMPRAAVARVVWKAFRQRLAEDASLRCWSASEIRVDAERPTPVEVDGEIAGWTPATFTVLPGRLMTIT